MQKKSLETILYSSAGIIVMLAIVIAVNFITGVKPVRLDLTQEKTYTLSEGTKTVLKKLDTPVKIRFYCTQSETATPETVYLKGYARQVEDLLEEYKQVAGKNLVIQKFDPQPDSDAADSARLDGLEPQQLQTGDAFYLGIAISLADQTVALPFLDPSRDRQLEYDVTRAITRVFTPEKPVVGVMSALPVFGDAGNPMMMQMGQAPQTTPPWTFVEQLKQDFTVRHVEMTADKIDDDVKVLVVIHPKEISETAQYAIDQFVMRGGKLIAYLDAQSLLSSRQQNPMMGGDMGGASSSLDKLLKAWGLQFDTGKVVADLNFKMQLGGRNGQPMEAPAFLALTSEGLNTNDVVTSQLDSVWVPMGGAFTGEPAAGLKETVLLNSTKDSELVDSMMASMGGASVLSGFKASGVNYKLAVRLTGKFKTAFPQGRPGDTNEVAKVADNSLKESKAETSVVLFGDSDMLADDFSLRKMDGPFGAMVSPMNANLDLAQNLVEQLAGDSNLIGVRSRATLSRPFTLVKKMEAQAEASGQAKIDELQQSLQQTQQRLGELQRQKSDKDQRFILSPEQKAEVENFRKKQGEISKELKQTQKDLHKEVVSLETRLKWLNILAMPLGVTMAGIGIAMVKRKKTSAK